MASYRMTQDQRDTLEVVRSAGGSLSARKLLLARVDKQSHTGRTIGALARRGLIETAWVRDDVGDDGIVRGWKLTDAAAETYPAHRTARYVLPDYDDDVGEG